MDSETGAPLNSDPYGYALCLDADSDNPDDYIISASETVDEDGETVRIYTAVQRG